MRSQRRPIELDSDGDRPTRCEGRRVRRVLDRWRYGGRWWRGEAPRDYWLLELEDGSVKEVYRSEGRWMLSRIVD